MPLNRSSTFMMPTIPKPPHDAQRVAVVSEAQSFIGTPYHHAACIKGVGVDCATFLAETYSRAGIIPPVEIPDYSPQWFMHQSAELYMAKVLEHAHEVTKPLPGDVALWKVGRCFAHGAIVVDWPVIIHAYKPAGIVLEARGTDASLSTHYRTGKPREVKFFSPW